jgi:hypothetical protein
MKNKKIGDIMVLSWTLWILFSVLKIMGFIDWPWIWVFSPLWIHNVIALIAIFVFLISAFIVGLFVSKKQKVTDYSSRFKKDKL